MRGKIWFRVCVFGLLVNSCFIICNWFIWIVMFKVRLFLWLIDVIVCLIVIKLCFLFFKLWLEVGCLLGNCGVSNSWVDWRLLVFMVLISILCRWGLFVFFWSRRLSIVCWFLGVIVFGMLLRYFEVYVGLSVDFLFSNNWVKLVCLVDKVCCIMVVFWCLIEVL